MKAISPIVATVLLIAFTVAVAGIVSIWLNTFTSSTTKTVEQRSTEELTCAYGGISLSGLKFSNGYLAGNIENTRLISLGKITLQIIYTNKTIQSQNLCFFGGTAINCTTANLSLVPREVATFNITSGTGSKTNIEKLWIYTNCSSVYDDADVSEIT